MDFLVHMKAAKQDHGHLEGPSEQPTDRRRRHHYLRDGALVEKPLVDPASLLVRKEVLHRILR